MEILSKEIQLQGLQLLKQTLEILVELEKQRSSKLDLISRKELMDLLGISATTLDNWEDLGLKRYQTRWMELRKYSIVRQMCIYF